MSTPDTWCILPEESLTDRTRMVAFVTMSLCSAIAEKLLFTRHRKPPFTLFLVAEQPDRIRRCLRRGALRTSAPSAPTHTFVGTCNGAVRRPTRCTRRISVRTPWRTGLIRRVAWQTCEHRRWPSSKQRSRGRNARDEEEKVEHGTARG